MAIKKPPEEHENHERWLISYADFITLLFAFFVVLYASSSRDQNKMQQVEASLTKSFGKHSRGMSDTGDGDPFSNVRDRRYTPIENQYSAPPPERVDEFLSKDDPLRALATDIKQYLKSASLKWEISTKVERSGITLTIDDAKFFADKSARLRPVVHTTFQRICKRIKEVRRFVTISGIASTSDSRSIDEAQELVQIRANKVYYYFREADVDSREMEVNVRRTYHAPLELTREFDDGMLIQIIIQR